MGTPGSYPGYSGGEGLAASYAAWTQTNCVQECQWDKTKLPPEIQIQILWLEGLLGRELTDNLGRKVLVLDPGTWNRKAGPDFLNARIAFDGEVVQGDVELDASPEDWEVHRHGSNPAFDQVILHLVCIPPAGAWFTRNSRHRHVPMAVIPQQNLVDAAALPAAEVFVPPCGACAPLFQTMSDDQVKSVLRAAAAHRMARKRKIWLALVEAVGEEQALFEILAETLGYHANKTAMKHLVRRAPLKEIKGNPEALLFGTAGFLVPVLPESCSSEARIYHKELWDCWWTNRERLELAPERAVKWVLSPIRPANHPQRRLAALAVLASRLGELRSLCSMKRIRSLQEFLTEIQHPYWSFHTTLPSKRCSSPLSLIGKDRVLDFVINHVLSMDEASDAWDIYLQLPAGQTSSRVEKAAFRLLGRRDDVQQWLRKAWMQQALLQLDADFCGKAPCETCPLPSQAPGWM